MMLLIILGYLVSSAVALYFFISFEKRMEYEGICGFDSSVLRAGWCAAFWFVTTPFYLAFLFSVWKFSKREGDEVVFVFRNGSKKHYRIYPLFSLLDDIRWNGDVVKIEKEAK